jgi:hypothetical protein
MIRTLSFAATFVVVVGVWPLTTPSHAASAPTPSLTSDSGVFLAGGAGARESRCPKGEVYDRKERKCVPAKEPAKVKEKKAKEAK